MKFFGGFFCAISVAGCSIIPDIPDDYNVPVREILQHATCELRGAFLELSDPRYASFGAGKWLIAVKLTPKADAEVGGGVGLTGKSTSLANPKHFNNWALGSVGAPGAAGDAKGTRNASITYKMSSKDLLDLRKPLICPVDGPRYHDLAQNLGIRDWLLRTVQAKDIAVGPLATLEAPTFLAEIVVKFTGNGNFTYNFPFGTNFAAISGSYDMDDLLEITTTRDTSGPVIVVQTLPTGGVFGNRPPDRIELPSRVDAEQRLENTQNQQGIINAIRNLPH
jgi:hypothetical protein